MLIESWRFEKMRTLFGIVIGIALTIGFAFVHDRNVVVDPANPRLEDQQIVNWEAFGDVTHDIRDSIANLWRNVTGK